LSCLLCTLSWHQFMHCRFAVASLSVWCVD
jgi:hypothetical protein